MHNESYDIQKFESINYLKNGSTKQQRIYKILTESKVMQILKDFSPILTGTFPIGIDIEGSDLDIICHVTDIRQFTGILKENFSDMHGYKQTTILQNNANAIVCNFFYDGMEFEIFGENKPVKQQNAYIHMINEYKALCKYGCDFREKIIRLKQSGMKTEPAFALALGLEGNPYEAMLQLEL